MKLTASRYHDFCAGHTVTGHESKCAHLHGHNYRVHFDVVPDDGELDEVGRVLDFSVIKETLCDWLEMQWDHKFLIWTNDARVELLKVADPAGIVVTSFNPTAENMAQYLMEVVGPSVLRGTGCRLAKVTIEETRKCSVSVESN